MTVTISGTTGIASVDGSAATPAVQGTDANTGIFYGTDIVAISTGGTERVRVNASGQAEFTAGTAALPAITTTGDTNTGIFFPAADTIAFAEGGVEAMRIASDGNVSFGGTAVMSSSFLRNRIINGDMRVDQRNAGASVTNTAATLYTIDRWAANATQASKFTIQRNAGSVTPPSGFVNYLGVTSSSAYSVLSGDTFDVRQVIEGLNVSDLAWGTASAATVTLSFWVRSSLTGTFGGALANGAFNRSYPFTYTISVANTWEQKTVTIAGDTSGTWLTTNGIGIHVFWGLGAGSTFSGTAGAWTGSGLTTATGATSVVGTNGATFYVTGVQLEVGTVATPFERQLYNAQLAQCQRYFCKSYDLATVPGTATFTGASATSTYATAFNGNGTLNFIFPVEMRSAPTVTMYSSINANTTGKCSSTTVDYNTNGASANTRQAYSSATSSGGVASQLFYQWAAAIEL